MTRQEAQKILLQCEVPMAWYEAKPYGVVIHLQCIWLGDWLTYRKYQFKSTKDEAIVVHFEFKYDEMDDTVDDYWSLINSEEEVVNIAYSLYRAAMLHECAEMFLYKNVQRFDPHCKVKRAAHCEDSRWTTLSMERTFMDNNRCETSTNANWGIPEARVFPKQKYEP